MIGYQSPVKKIFWRRIGLEKFIQFLLGGKTIISQFGNICFI